MMQYEKARHNKGLPNSLENAVLSPFFTLLTIASAAFESKKGEASSTFCNTYSEMSVGHAKLLLLVRRRGAAA